MRPVCRLLQLLGRFLWCGGQKAKSKMEEERAPLWPVSGGASVHVRPPVTVCLWRLPFAVWRLPLAACCWPLASRQLAPKTVCRVASAQYARPKGAPKCKSQISAPKSHLIYTRRARFSCALRSGRKESRAPFAFRFPLPNNHRRPILNLGPGQWARLVGGDSVQLEAALLGGIWAPFRIFGEKIRKK